MRYSGGGRKCPMKQAKSGLSQTWKKIGKVCRENTGEGRGKRGRREGQRRKQRGEKWKREYEGGKKTGFGVRRGLPKAQLGAETDGKD